MYRELENSVYAKIVGAESLGLARAEAARRGSHLRGRKRRKEKIVIPTRFRLAEGEGDAAQELYARILPLW